MARVKFLTRTIRTINADVIVLDLNTLTTECVSINVPATCKTDKDILTAAAAVIGDGKTAVKVESAATKYQMYRIPEDTFIAHAELVGTYDYQPGKDDTANDQ